MPPDAPAASSTRTSSAPTFVVHDHGHEAIRVQVKTTEHATIVGGNAYSFSLDIKTYDRLRQGGTRATSPSSS